jgi:hypothetical protein
MTDDPLNRVYGLQYDTFGRVVPPTQGNFMKEQAEHLAKLDHAARADQERKAAADLHRRNYNATHYAGEVQQIPEHAHVAVLVNKSFTYDDGRDERGQPSMSTTNHLSYIWFDSDEALEAWVLANHQRETYRVIHVKPVTVTLKTVITVEKE